MRPARLRSIERRGVGAPQTAESMLRTNASCYLERLPLYARREESSHLPCDTQVLSQVGEIRNPCESVDLGGKDVEPHSKVRRDVYAEFLRMNVFGADDQRHRHHALRFLSPLFHCKETIDQSRNGNSGHSHRINEKLRYVSIPAILDSASDELHRADQRILPLWPVNTHNFQALLHLLH